MGRFLNPDNTAFQTALNSEIYIDKTELLTYTNKVIGTKQAFICNSRPRRLANPLLRTCLLHTIVKAVIPRKCLHRSESASQILLMAI